MEAEHRGLARLVRENRAVPSDEQIVRAVASVLENYERRAGPEGVQGIVLTDEVPYGQEALDTLLHAEVLRVPEYYDPMTGQDALLELDADRLSSYAERSNVYDDPRLREALGLLAREGPLGVQTRDVVAEDMYALLERYHESDSEHLSLRDHGANIGYADEAVRQLEALGVISLSLSEDGIGELYAVHEQRIEDLLDMRSEPYQ